MTFLSAEQAPHSGGSVFSTAFSGLQARAFASWRRYQAERALEALSYDTLKDIGFPSANGAIADPMKR